MSDNHLTELLQSLTSLVGGSAFICDDKGNILCTPTDNPDETSLHQDERETCIRDAANLSMAVYVTERAGISSIVIHLYGGNWLILNNQEQIAANLKHKEIIIQSLPYIAQVAGGDAVLFNSNGMRDHAFHPDGSPNPGAIGISNELCRMAMKEQRPSIGPSTMVPGSTAVRIPLTKDYGLAFNNRYAASRHQRLLEDARRYSYARYHMGDIIGESNAIAKVKTIALTAAKTQSTILITGETGTGKEIFAQAIHNASPRSAQPFVAINCGALPANLVESTLFGYVEGSFTGAKKGGQEGAFEQASGGTLFLDEISEMPLDLQVKLLRAIQEREIIRVGDTKPRAVDVRIIASTNKPLVNLVRAGIFRVDLYFRLNVLEILIPPLRERKEDLLALTDFFINKYSIIMAKTINDISPAVMKVLTDYAWPGNVRELQNSIEHVFNVIDNTASSITLEHLPHSIGGTCCHPGTNQVSPYENYMRQVEREFVLKALQASGGNKTEAAKRLGLNRTTFWRILKRHNLHQLQPDSAAEKNNLL
jgi:DNA-binding NtrC family response regulator